ncbi:hypothetical protein [Massilia consociata]|uniref:Uncharacterized protein n=1 Tax=Massilia consociata TaxID=760117 RepID=A0ABV6FML8_9BURK
MTDDLWVPPYAPDEPDPVVIASRVGRDTTALFNYHVREKRQGEMLVGHPTQDILSPKAIDQEAREHAGDCRHAVSADLVLARLAADAVASRHGAAEAYQYPVREAGKTGTDQILGRRRPGTLYLFDYPGKKMTTTGKVNHAPDLPNSDR